ncbi:hypothetical protein ACH4OY_19500 [Micromonospora rubida]|uniref:RNA polymerase subunit sigma-70 n=1 Tax=Micromonospora rubida TaxID=2697657 RepID=A0ABW7SQP8_9ACTN
MAEPEAMESEQAFNAALDALNGAYAEAVEAIRGVVNPQNAFACATTLADSLRATADAAADVRAQTAARIWEEERLSLTGLADRISVSKARAGQLVQRAKQIKEQS